MENPKLTRDHLRDLVNRSGLSPFLEIVLASQIMLIDDSQLARVQFIFDALQRGDLQPVRDAAREFGVPAQLLDQVLTNAADRVQ